MQIKAVIFDIFGVFYKPRLLLGGYYDEEMISLVKDLKSKDIKVFAISNSFDVFPELHQVFDKIYFAGKIGFYKPDPEIFEYVLKKENLNPTECVYFDDSEKNVFGAKKVGINSFLIKGSREVSETLSKFIV